MPYFHVQDRRLFYRDAGNGPLLVILPGNTASSASHDSELHYFSHRYRTLVPDLPGTGRSYRMDPWPSDWWRHCAEAVATLVGWLGHDRYAVMGTSGGGALALLCALGAPDRVTAVVADSCVARLTGATLRRLIESRDQAGPELTAWWQRAHGEDWRRVLAADGSLLGRFAETGLDYFQGRLGEIRCPVLLTASLRDNALPDLQQQVTSMAEQIPSARVYLANTGGHPFMWTSPSEFRRVSGEFLETVLKDEPAAARREEGAEDGDR
jgi:pimeloyl-ACP methyl ester carboxylesterase